MAEYYGWIFVEEKLPPLNEEVLVAYVEDGEVEYLLTKYGDRKVISSVYNTWYLPQYYKVRCVKAWRKIPPFVVEKVVE
jgi:hypothetical protein